MVDDDCDTNGTRVELNYDGEYNVRLSIVASLEYIWMYISAYAG